MPNPFFSYDNQLIPGQLARAEAVANDFILVQTGFALLVTQGVDSGVVNAYVVTTQGQPTVAYADGNTVQFKPLVGNTGASTVNVNSVGVIPVLRFNGAALLAGDLVAGVWATLVYNTAFNAFTITGPGQNVVVAGSISAAAPTHKVGLVAAAGVATSVAPIDATYAIDQGIAPTWLGVHTFSATPVMNAGLTVTGAAITSSAGLTVSAGTSAVQALTATTGVFASTLSAAGVTSSAGLTVTGSAITSSAGLTVSAGTSAVQALTATTGVFASTLSAAGITSSAGLTVSAGGATVTAGSVVIGVPTGGGQGTGTVNATGLFVNGVAVVAGATVSSISGTANQIAASASTGAVTLSFPHNMVIPTSLSGSALTINSTAGDALVLNTNHTAGLGLGFVDTNGSPQSYRMGIGVGNGSNALNIFDSTNAAIRLQLFADGGIAFGVPTGGDQGAGTLNCAGLFVNGVAVTPGTTVIVSKVATAIETRTSTTAQSNSSQLTYAIPVTGTYAIRAVAYLFMAVGPGYACGMNYSGSFTANSSMMGLFEVSSTPANFKQTQMNAVASNMINNTGNATNGVPFVVVIEATLTATGTGTLAFNFAQQVSNINPTTLGIGSYMQVTKIA